MSSALFSRRRFLAMAAVGRVTPPEWKRYPDPATELEVFRLTDPSFASGMTMPHLRQFSRRSDLLLYWSERPSSPDPSSVPQAVSRQAFVLDLNQGQSRQLSDAAALDPSSLSLSSDERSFVYFDGDGLYETQLAALRSRQIHSTPPGAKRTGLTVGSDGAVLFIERETGQSRLVSVFRSQSRKIADIDRDVDEVMARPRHSQVLYRAGGELWLINGDGSARRRLKTEPGQTGGAQWIPSGRTLVYLHIPDDTKELITLREHAPDDGSDRLLAKTSQFISASPNADASVFTGASRSRASAYVLILLRAARRELTLCEHRASDPAMVRPVFTPDSQSVLFVSDRHGKPAIYRVHVNRFVEETGGDQ